MPLDDDIIRVAEAREVDIEALKTAANFTERESDGLKVALQARFPPADYPGLDVVLSGSFARREVTRGSDCDYLILVDQTPQDPRTVPRMAREMEVLLTEMQLKPPGQGGLFGEFATSGELLGRIGLESDSNANMTRRMSVLAESVSIYNPAVRQKVVDTIIMRYCDDYQPDIRRSSDPIRVPRFLLNDLIRYWRTMAVDFGAKRWRSISGEWYLRFVKLVTSRKMLFAGSLAALFLVEKVCSDADQGYDALIVHLQSQFGKTPLARLMSAYAYADDEGQEALGSILAAYAKYVEILQRSDTRNLLARRASEEGVDEQRARERQSEVDALCDTLQANLERVFFSDPMFRVATARYGLF